MNDNLVNHTANAFRTFTFDVKSVLHQSEADLNNLTIIFKSALHYSLQEHKIWANLSLPEIFAHTRKPAFHYGWDWAAKLNTCGIVKSVYLRAYSQMRIGHVLVRNSEIDAGKKGAGSEVLIYGTIEIESITDYTEQLLNLEIKVDNIVKYNSKKTPELV